MPEEAYLADKALYHYFGFVKLHYRQQLAEAFTVEEAKLLYHRTYLQFSSLWFCKDVIHPFAKWFIAVMDTEARAKIDETWETLEIVLRSSIGNMIAFIRRVKEAHGQLNWLTAREGMLKAANVFAEATGNLTFAHETALLWDVINHKKFKCISTSIAFAFVGEILGEWQEVRIGFQLGHIYVADVPIGKLQVAGIYKQQLPFRSSQKYLVDYLKKSDVNHADREWNFSSMGDLQLPLAYEGQSAFIFVHDIFTVQGHAGFINKSYLKHYGIEHLTTEAEVVQSYQRIMGSMVYGKPLGALMSGIMPTPLAGMKGGYITALPLAQRAAQQIVEQAPLMFRLNGSYGQHPFGIEHAMYLYYKKMGGYIRLNDENMFYFQYWILQQNDIGYL